MPTDASSSSGLTMSGKRRSLGRWKATSAHHEVWDADPLIREHLLGQRLVAREHQAARRCARVRHAQHVHRRRDRVVEGRLTAKVLSEIEDDIRGLGAQPGHQLFGVVAKAVQPNLVTSRDQSARDVELSLVPGFELLLVVLRRRRLAVRVEEKEHAGFLQAPP